MTGGACDDCLRRAALIARLAGHLDTVRARIAAVLALGDEELIDAVAGTRRAEVRAAHAAFDARAQRGRISTAGVVAVCRCAPAYPERLRDLDAPPAAVFVAGELERLAEVAAGDAVAVVGARRASAYGRDVARALARGLARAGVPVISGMALGVDAAAHSGALEAGGRTLAVLPGPAERPYPAAKRALYRRIVDTGAAVSELPPGAPVRRWMFPARNRTIAALARVTVVVEAGERSGALVTARWARGLGRTVGAVPGPVSSPMSWGPNELLGRGASLVRDAGDVLELLFGASGRPVDLARLDCRPALEPDRRRLLDALGSGEELEVVLRREGIDALEALAALAELELAGYVRREAGGRFTVVP